MGWPRDRWLWYVTGYWKAADVIAAHVAETGQDQDGLIYPFLMCWRHYAELQLKALITVLADYHRESVPMPKTHRIDHLWRVARPLCERAFPQDDEKDQDDMRHAERLLLQLHELDPTSEHFRYPIQKDGSDTLAKLNRVHIRRFNEAMVGVAHFLDAADTGLHVMLDARNEYEEEMYHRYYDT